LQRDVNAGIEGIKEQESQRNYITLEKAITLFQTPCKKEIFIYCTLLTNITASFNDSILLLLGISVGTTGIAYTIDTSFAKKNPGASQKNHNDFLSDILSDGNGYSVQRIQIFAWNLVLGLYFISYTFNNKSMPEFSTPCYSLQG
jgi:hypothetical protein